MTAIPRHCCPDCRGDLADHGTSLACNGCHRHYPVVLGIPDLRTAPDPWIGPAEDRAKGAKVDAEAGPGFEAAVRHYWRLTPETAPGDAARHIAHVLHAEHRSREWIASVVPPATMGEVWLDLGCGTADLACAAPHGIAVIGVDVAFRWLAVARRRMQDAHRVGLLICGNAERLPFPDASFDRVIALGTLEHCADLTAVLTEARRVLRPGGIMHLRAVNRCSLLPEPHVGLWGVAWLPRRMADRYARMRGRGGYRYHWPRTVRELTAGLRKAGFIDGEIAAAVPLESEVRRLPQALRPFVRAYSRTRHWSAVRAVAPLLEGRGRRP